MPTLNFILQAVQVLAPLIEELAHYIAGTGDKPVFMSTLPVSMKSRVALEAKKARCAS